jgi:ion channel
MPTVTLHPRWEQILEQRCFFLFLALLALLIALPFLAETAHGRLILTLVNVTVMLSAIAAVGRSRLSLVIAVVLVVPALVLRFLALGSNVPGYFAMSMAFNAAFYTYVLADLLHYVLRRDVMTGDKLYGAVCAYILIAVLWANLHGVVQYVYPGSYGLGGTTKVLDMTELIYFSFTALTTSGFGDVTPLLVQSRFLTILEMLTGVMYIAILIARLTGVYPVIEKKP